ncbi:unnamed protein product [Effrenium voratum]|nr:unnamed protein product [Effrenium voratum]
MAVDPLGSYSSDSSAALSTGSAKKCAWLLQSEIVRNWKQLLGVWVTFFITAGMTYHAPPVMLPAIMAEFGADQYGVSWLPAVFQLCKGVLSIPGGYALHHYGCHFCFKAGSVLILAAAVLYPLAPSLWLLAGLHGVYGAAYDLCGMGPVIVWATTWFQRSPALAIGLLASAFSTAAIVFSPLTASLVQHHGWRLASLLCPVLMLLVAVPVSFKVIQDGPRRHQRLQGSSGLSFRRSLCLPAVWHLAFLQLYQLYIMIALINSLVMFLKTDVGMSLELSGVYSSIVFQAATISKLLMGVAMDSEFQSLAGLLGCLLLLSATLMPLDLTSGGRTLTHNWGQLLGFVVVLGLAQGMCFNLVCSKAAKMFGRMPEYSKLQSFFMTFQMIGGFLGTLVTGKLRARSGDYTLSFYVFIVMALLGCCHYLCLERCRWKMEARNEVSEPIPTIRVSPA